MEENGKITKIILGSLSLYLLWLCLTFPLNAQEAVFGLAVVAAAAVFFGKYFAVLAFRKNTLAAVLQLTAYVPFLLWQIVKANIDVARIVLSFPIRIKPAIVRCRTTLESDFAKTILANSITLTPGTLTVDIIDGYIYIHCINIEDTGEEYAYEHIVKGFEERIKRFSV